jgi:hypothetical protein
MGVGMKLIWYQVVGGSGFIISSSLFMLETQEKWYRPAPKSLGWHIGFWNLVGGIGFCLCGALGLGSANPNVEYASTLATFIGSWAFLVSHIPLVSSVVQAGKSEAGRQYAWNPADMCS